MAAQLIAALIVVAFHCRVLDRVVRPLNLGVGPRMVRFGQLMLDTVGCVDHVEVHRLGIDRVTVSRLNSELDAAVREDAAGNDFEEKLQKLASRHAVRFLDQLRHGELAGSIKCHKQIELALRRPELDKVNMKELDWLALEPRLCEFVSAYLRQTRDTIPLQASMQE